MITQIFNRLHRFNPCQLQAGAIANCRLHTRVETGFTLIELLIVLAIILIINFALVGFFISIMETSQRGSQSLNRVGTARSAMSIISRDIRSAAGIVPAYQEYKMTESSLILKGSQRNGTYIIYLPDKNSPNILQRIVYSKETKNIGLVFPIIHDLEHIRFTFDKAKGEQATLVTVSLDCHQTKFMEKNLFTLVAVTKLRNKL